jgi:hypothetical protein
MVCLLIVVVERNAQTATLEASKTAFKTTSPYTHPEAAV